jgi:hypothetical protein
LSVKDQFEGAESNLAKFLERKTSKFADGDDSADEVSV